MRTLEHGVIALPAATHLSKENSFVGEQISSRLPSETPGAQVPFIRTETLGFFQLAVAYGVDAVVNEQINEGWSTKNKDRRIRRNFNRDFHLTNRYLNTFEATYATVMPYAGVNNRTTSQLIVHRTLARLYDNFPWDQVPPDVAQRYPRDLVVRGKTLTNRSSEGRKSVSESSQKKWKSPEYRTMMATATSQANTGRFATDETRKLLKEYWRNPDNKKAQSDRFTGREVSSESKEKISQSKLGKPRPDLKGKKFSDEELQSTRDGKKRRKDLDAMREAGIDTTALEEAWKEERRVRKNQMTRRWMERQQAADALEIKQPSDSLAQAADVFDASK